MSLQQVVTALNEHALAHPIGGLPEWRKQHKGKERLPRTIFYAKVPDADKDRDYVFHVGGLSELQFNVGFELVDDIRTFRYGIAFSLQPTRELPEDKVVALLRRKSSASTSFSASIPRHSRGLRCGAGIAAQPNHPVATIPTKDIHLGNFIFIGKLQPADAIDLDAALDDLDQLLPVYEYVKGEESFPAGTAESERQGSRAESRAAKTSYIRTAKAMKSICITTRSVTRSPFILKRSTAKAAPRRSIRQATARASMSTCVAVTSASITRSRPPDRRKVHPRSTRTIT